MELGFLLTLSCVMTTISMIVLVGVLLFFARFGGQGVKMLIDRFLGGNDDNPQQQSAPVRAGAQASVASSRSLRQRAQNLDFPAPARASTQFGAQSAPTLGQNQNAYPDFPPPQNQGFQQASLSPRGNYPEFNPQALQPSNSSQGFQPSTPSLSPSRPFQGGSSLNRPVQQNQNFGQPQYPQQGNNYNQLGQSPQPNQFGRQQAQSPNQGLQPLQPNQQGFNAQGLPPQQPQQPQNPQYGGLGQNRPPLRSRPNPGNTQYDPPIGGRDRRQGDDRDYIYDDRRDGGNFIDDVGDFIDNF